jgi:hypothetical protein
MLKLILNIFGFSVLEESVIVYFLLYLIKFFKISNHSYFEVGYNHIFCKNFIKAFFISILPISVITNVLSFLYMNSNMITITAILLMYISINFLLNNSLSILNKVILIPIIAVSFLISCSIDLTIYKILFYITQTNIDYMKDNVYITIIFGLFPRIIEFSILGILFFKNNIGIKTNVIEKILKDKFLLVLFSLFIIINTIGAIFICQNIVLGNILKNSNDFYKLIFILGVFLDSIANILICYFLTTFIQLDERKKYKYGN